MSTMIQIRNVPDEIHRTLKARAAMSGLSLSDYLLREMRVLAQQPTIEELRARLAAAPVPVLTESPTEALRAERDSR